MNHKFTQIENVSKKKNLVLHFIPTFQIIHSKRDNRQVDSLFKSLGDHNRDINESEQIIQVSKYIVHENYQNTPLNNDLALVHLEKPVIFGKNVQPVCLPKQGEKPDVGEKCYMTG